MWLRDGIASTTADRRHAEEMTRRTVWTIGAGQCVSWGVLYYAFSVWLVPVERDLGAERWLVTGAFSSALLVSAVAAPTIGLLTDRGRGPAVMQAGGLIAAGLLGLWAAAPSLWMSYLVWSALGFCMAAVLYEPAFAMVGRAIDDGRDRLRAVGTITVLGGLASTVFLPFAAWLVDRFGWRVSVCGLALCLAGVTTAVYWSALRKLPTRATSTHALRSEDAQLIDSPIRRGEVAIRRLSLTFAFASFASSALVTNLVPALLERGLSATTAATFAGLFGVMQLPGRVLLMNGGGVLSPTRLVWVSLGLQVAGLVTLLSTRSSLPVALAVALFACGSGLATIARPHLVVEFYGPKRAGHLNGTIARAQHFARAAGPVSGAALSAVGGYNRVFAVLAALLIAAMVTMVKADVSTTDAGYLRP